VIRERAEAVKALGVPILLRWRWEMNRPNLQASVWSPADYVAAWKHVRAIFTEVGATNAGWVWCPIATDFDSTDAADYYPGDDEVEWLCSDVYPGPSYDSFSDVSSEFMAWASKHDKPIIIAEYGAEDEGDSVQRAQWLAAAGAYAQAHPQIKAMVYFESRLSQNGADRDFTLTGTAAPLAAFRAMALAPYFTKRTSP
jgi:beta-mannanase